MLTALRSRCSSWKLPAPNRIFASSPSVSSAAGFNDSSEVLTLPEVEKILSDVKADNVTVIPNHNHGLWADFTVIATGRSDWHLKNIAQALVYRAKQKQIGAKHVTLPSVQGYNSKWIVIDYGKFVVHALDEKARAYFNLESLWTAKRSDNDNADQDLQNAFVKVRPKNNSKRKPKT
ncbi:Protein Iojap-related [Cardamine amara subsp. amara]|uniref:Protein Iojap-related n=1 Tax=Cardamine amara subsp. amara TaxID=228776 RepID=A0ABD1BBY5_CARAN